MFVRPLCSNPQIIFNRGCLNALYLSSHYYLDGKLRTIDPATIRLWQNDTDFKFFNRMLSKFRTKEGTILWEKLENYYFIDYLTKDKVYLFQAVACGHCVLCNEKRTNDFSTRCNMESSVSYTRPIMITLTYQNEYLPLYTRPFVTALTDTIVSYETFTAIGSKQTDNVTSLVKYQSLVDGKIVDVEHQLPIQQIQIPIVGKDLHYLDAVFCGRGWNLDTCLQPDHREDGIEYIPNLHKPDVQKFWKRLRRQWEYHHYAPKQYIADCVKNDKPIQYHVDHPFRYVIVGEYGTKKGRPHYHALLFNVPYDIRTPFDFEELARLKNDIVSAWGMAQPQSIQCEIARDAGKYIGKYLSKGNKNGRKGFCNASNRGGGIGSSIIDSHREFFHTHPEQNQIQFVDYSGKLQTYTLGQYATRRLFPTSSRMIPDVAKHLLRKANHVLSDINKLYSVLGSDQKGPLQSVLDSLNIDPLRLYSEIGYHSLDKRTIYRYADNHGELTNAEYSIVLESLLTDLDFRIKSLILSRYEFDEEVIYDTFPDYSIDNTTKQLEINKLHFDSLDRPLVTDDIVAQRYIQTAINQQVREQREVF